MTAHRVLALDLSLSATGVCVPDGTLSTMKPSSKGDIRFHEIQRRIRDLLIKTEPTMVVLEGPVTRSEAATVIGMLHGAVRTLLLDWGMAYLIVPPATLKTYATGRGNAPKPDMRMELYKRAGVDEADDNKVDAAWLWYLALDLAGTQCLVLPQSHRRALDKLTMPEPAVVS